MSQTAAGRIIELSPQSIGRLEDGQATRISSLHVAALCDAYGASAMDRAILANLAQEVRQARKTAGRWWSAYADLVPARFGRRLALEQAATTVTSFENTMVSDLLRTPDYHRATERTRHPRDSSERIERRVQITMRRQEVLYGNDFDLRAYLLQSVLHHPVGGPAVMHRQLSHLHEVGQLPNVSIRIVPHTAGSHIGLHIGQFVLLEFGTLPATGLIEPPIAYVEKATGDLCLDQDRQTMPYRLAVIDLDRVALDENRSRTLIGETAKTYRSYALPRNRIRPRDQEMPHERQQGTP